MKYPSDTPVCRYCRVCKSFVPRELFNARASRVCRPCQANRAGLAALSESRDRQLRRTYGITLEQYNEMLREQNGRCKICGRKQPSRGKCFPVDHDHKTGAVRGILCYQCNTGLGAFRDNVTILKSAIKYLG